MKPIPSSLRGKLPWIAVLYLAEGFPYGTVYDLLPVYFRTHGVSLKEIGLLSLIGIPWSFKVFWSPLVDLIGERRQWIFGCLLAMAALLAVLPVFDPASPSRLLWAVLLGFTIFAATQDIAIDAYTIGLVEKGHEEGMANSMRVSAYRAALVLSGGGLVALGGILPWRIVLWIAAGILATLALFARRAPSVEVSAQARTAFFRPLWRWIARPGAPLVLVFILVYKLGDAAMAPMIKPFWVDRGLSPEEIGLISTTVGVIATVVGAFVGGAWVTRVGVFHGLWQLGIAQAVSNLGYASAAWFDLPREAIYAASVLESFCSGLGTAAFLSFLMNLCDKEYAAVEYAMLSAIFGFSRSISGAVSGWATEQMGYGAYFAFTFLLAFPAYALLPVVRRWVRTTEPAHPSP
ncbi:MAG: MFS transporter [Candidatus Eisenbacteria bacterium]